MKRNCAICEKKLVSARTGEEEMEFSDPPDNATYWHTGDNPGSTVYDSYQDREQLEISICDECLVALGDKGMVRRFERRSNTKDKGDWKRFKLPAPQGPAPLDGESSSPPAAGPSAEPPDLQGGEHTGG